MFVILQKILLKYYSRNLLIG